MEIQDRSRNKTDKNYDEKNLEVEHFQLFGEGKVATPTTDGILTFINKKYEDAFVWQTKTLKHQSFFQTFDQSRQAMKSLSDKDDLDENGDVFIVVIDA